MDTPGWPERTCVGCRGKASRRDLLRLVRSSDGVVRVDATGSAPGRGAYLHRDRSCVRDALLRGALGRALRAGLAPEEAARLGRDIEGELQG
jgi:uncharacterized protein